MRRVLIALAAASSLSAAPAPFEPVPFDPAPVDPAPAANEAAADAPGVFVLGIDGMDPVILQRKMDEGSMPNFARLAAQGTFQELGTSNPPQSPVAWSNFVTGMNPGGHGIFDFLHRDPATGFPVDSAMPKDVDCEAYIELFGWYLPTGDAAENNRMGTPFWDVLHDAGVTTEVYRMPGNYPPTPSEALTLSGMGTVDMRGTAGTYTWFTDQIMFDSTGLKADYQPVTVEDIDGDGTGDTVYTYLKGAPDVFHIKPCDVPSGEDHLRANVLVHIDPESDVVWIKAGGDIEDGTIAAPRSEAVVREGEWTPWMEMDFEALPLGMMNLTGMARFYVKSVRPDFVMYGSPVNVAPSAPAQPVTTPDDGIEELHEHLGNFFTQGMPEETNALSDGLFDEDDYISQVALVHEDGDAMLELAVDRFDRGDMTFMYLSDIDLQCHMLWRHHDPKDPDAPRHPGYDPNAPPRWGQAIDGYYERVDRTLGWVRERLPEDALFIVMSDHGFQAQTRNVHLNAWLRDEGYLVLDEGVEEGRRGHIDVDWTRTRAYGVGFNGLYVNMEGREAKGIVPAEQAPALIDELVAKLEALTDPKDGRRMVKRAARATDAYSGAMIADAPDIIVGFDKGYGCSDESTLGETPAELVIDNLKGFTGSHLMAPEVVPGVLLVNRRLGRDGHDLTDVTATILDHYGLPPADGMVGASFIDRRIP